MSTVGPGTSALIIFIVFPDDRGITAITKTNTPIPPIQWVKDLQNRIPIGSASISVRIVDPVVVKPDTVSKNASIGLDILPVRK